MSVAASTAIAIGVGAGTAGAGMYAAHKSASSADHAADVQSTAAADALAFQKQQAAQDLANANAIQKANYDQWVAKQGRLSILGQRVGMPAHQIPAFVPLSNAANVTTTGTPTGQPVQPTGPRAYTTSMSKAFGA